MKPLSRSHGAGSSSKAICSHALAIVILALGPVVRGQLAWRNVDPGEPISVMGAFDQPGDPAIYALGSGYPATMWRWSDLHWSPIMSEPNLGIRWGSGLAFNRLAGSAVLFGGRNNLTSSYLNDTWIWSNRVWSRVLSTTSPSPRQNPTAFVYDAHRARLVLHGGFYYGQGASNDTWEWDGQNWALMVLSTPPPRWFGAGTYDERRGVTVIFGGCDPTGQALNDTWEWDGTSWVVRATSGTRPPARLYHAMAYDSRRQVVLLAGGVDAARNMLSDVWEWDGMTWTPRADAPLPVPRSGHLLVHNGARGVTVLLEGSGFVIDAGVPQSLFPPRVKPIYGYSRTWEFDGMRWTERTSGKHPFDPTSAVAAYNRSRASVVIYGIKDMDESPPATPPAFQFDTWEWRDGRWTRRTPISRPPTRGGTAIAFDEMRSMCVLFGGSGYSGTLADTWEWDGNDWVPRAAGPLGPPGRSAHAMTYDSRRGVTVLVGGSGQSYGFNSEDTWEWNGTSWRLAGSMPPLTGRVNASLAYDRRRGVAVLFGGRTLNGSVPSDLWEWDGQRWTLKVPESGLMPPPRMFAGMAYDERRGVIVLSGGQGIGLPPNSYYHLSDTWEWDGTTWRQIAASAGPVPGSRVMVYDQNRDVLFLPPCAGRQYLPSSVAAPPTYNDTWVLEDMSRLGANTLNPPPGGNVTFTLRFPQDAGRSFVAAASFGIYPGIRVADGRIVPLNLDPLLLASVAANSPTFVGFSGVLDGLGEARPVLNIPARSTLSGLEFLVAGVSLSGGAIGSISNPVRIRIQ